METKLCRICGKLTDNYVNIFKTEGLKNKLETCLPIIVSQHCLLPDTMCIECTGNVETFYSFMKNCLEKLIILESQYDMHESCLRSKRRFEKGICTETPVRQERSTQTDEVSFLKFYSEDLDFSKTLEEVDKEWVKPLKLEPARLVSYDLSGDESEEDDSGKPMLPLNVGDRGNDVDLDNFLVNKQYFDNQENNLINKIAQRISLKRKSEEVLSSQTKICKLDVSNRRKNRQPKKIQNVESLNQWSPGNGEKNFLEENFNQACLLCDRQFGNAALLSSHVFETHGIDMAQVLSSEPILEKKKRIPNLVKIADLKPIKIEQDDPPPPELELCEPLPPPPEFACPLCTAVPLNRTDLFNHLRVKHPKQSSLMCGLCLQVTNGFAALTDHLATCKQAQPAFGKYICKICCYSDDSPKLIENHVIVHDYVIQYCRNQARIFDPCDYVEVNEKCDSALKTYTCTECNQGGFEDFKDFSSHRRSQHQIFHCDLCNKFYGRNSHLWKHVNRLHKGHPSITCQLCHKTSASKYHLAQHFGKIHSNSGKTDDFLKQKFQGFDFQSVKQSFLRQDLMAARSNNKVSDGSENEMALPKEIDASSNLYTNIITNYTPPQNNGEFKCQKCFKGFHKKNLLKKHKKNCRPRLQKDLLTRCKTCSRIFKDRQSLTKHLINYHSEYACEICGQKFQSKCEIVSHIRFTHPNCHLFCTCGNILRNKSDLLAHKNDHYNSFVCQFCADTLPTKIKLKMHILSLHRKILSLSCGICLRLFETQHILRDHVRLAHKEHLLPLTSCTVCGKNYGSKWKTYDHLNKSHGRIFKACKACLEVFDSDKELETHYETAHSKFVQKNNPAQVVDNNAKKEEYESDFDQQINLENEEKATNSDDVSNESKNNSRSDSEDVKNFIIHNMADENKISLLEKRLLGKKIINNEKQGGRKSNSDELQNSSKRTVYVNSNDPSLCEICLKTWPAKKHLWQHYIRCHKSVAATVCGICLKANESYEALQKHLHETHPTLLHGQGFGSNFICRICGRYHNASSKLKLHMAIHENFDWSLLDSYSNHPPSTIKTEPETQIENGQLEINYESLIEQVECSSESEESEDEEKSPQSPNNDNSSSSDASDDNESEISEENSLESQMLQNMLIEKQLLQQNNIKAEELTTSDSDDSSNSSSERDFNKAEIKSENCTSDDEEDDSDDRVSIDSAPNIFERKPEELDSAIKSISYEQVNNENEQIIETFCEIQAQQNLNPYEIQSAVDSIL